MENIYLKDSVGETNTQIISAKSGKIIEKGKNKFLNLSYGQILDIENNNFRNTKVIKFNNTTFNLSNLKTKSTTIPKFQELNSNILVSCVNNFTIGKREEYTLPIFRCTKESSVKSSKEVFNRSFKQIYIITLAVVATMLLFTNDKNPRNFLIKLAIFFLGLAINVLSEVNAEFLNISTTNNLIIVLTPLIMLVLFYIFLINLNKKHI